MFGFRKDKRQVESSDLTIHPEILAAFNRPKFVSASPDDARIIARMEECAECERIAR